MKTDLSNIHPTIAGALSGALDESYCPHGILATRCPIHNPKPVGKTVIDGRLGGGVRVYCIKGDYEVLIIGKDGAELALSPDQVQKLETFLGSIGWRCS